ncbi:MAG: ParB N-terminal domain-containing protein [Pseudomonadota bacterium]|nr:ParB N-terminal domain-containing protein [Pseudomonadota bacterium]
MNLRTVDPRTLKANPANPRRTGAGAHPDVQMVANIQAVGILQPPVVRENGADLEIVAGHRRVAAAIAAGFPEILVLVRGPDDGGDALRAMSENIVRAQMGPVDQWRAIEALVSADWTEDAIATALALPVAPCVACGCWRRSCRRCSTRWRWATCRRRAFCAPSPRRHGTSKRRCGRSTSPRRASAPPGGISRAR